MNINWLVQKLGRDLQQVKKETRSIPRDSISRSEITWQLEKSTGLKYPNYFALFVNLDYSKGER